MITKIRDNPATTTLITLAVLVFVVAPVVTAFATGDAEWFSLLLIPGLFGMAILIAWLMDKAIEESGRRR
jgi:hypothetical protein